MRLHLHRDGTMRSTFSVLLFLNAFHLAQSVVFPQSRPTSSAENTPDAVNGWTPKPTQAPMLRGKPGWVWGGMKRRDELFARDSSSTGGGGSSSGSGDLATCGWYDANVNYALTCDAGSACAYITYPSPQWWACCPTTQGEIDWPNCPYYSKCYQYDSYSAPNTWTGSYEYAPDGTTSFFW